tara:strand:+ start:546 stop:1046 length:501 start_codon:yes stop_codon:yes gene_type:complete
MYILKPEMAQELKQTTSQIYTDTPNNLYNSKFIATIGDICTVKLIQEEIIPNLMIVDYKTKRNIKLTEMQMSIIESVKSKSVKVDNEPGTISQQLYFEIKNAIKSEIMTKIIVNGEEDLATLPVIKHSKIGAKVIYGMPDKGMVVVDVNQRTKERANKLLKKMLVK